MKLKTAADKKKKTNFVLLIMLSILLGIVLFFFLVFPYIKAEYYTAKYGEQFKDLYSLTHMIGDVEFYKVVEYDETSAKVYYVDSDTTNYVYFYRVSKTDEWKMETWETVWSKYGSASDIAWPYYFKDFIQ